jgi:hypothetical protein
MEKESGSEGWFQISQRETVDIRVQKRRGEEAELAVPQFLLKVQPQPRYRLASPLLLVY